MKKVLFLATVLLACVFASLAVSETAEDSDGAEIGVWYYYRGIAPDSDDSFLELIRMEKMESVPRTYPITLTNVPELREFDGFVFSHWSVFAINNHYPYEYLIGEYTNEEIEGLSVSYDPIDESDTVQTYWVYAVYIYNPSEKSNESEMTEIYVASVCIVCILCLVSLTIYLFRKK